MGIGVHSFERQNAQRVIIDVELEVAADLPFQSDNLRAVVDYDFLRDMIRQAAASRHFDTQEALCHEILSQVMAREGVLRGIVSTRKPDVYEDAVSVGCRMTSTKSV